LPPGDAVPTLPKPIEVGYRGFHSDRAPRGPRDLTMQTVTESTLDAAAVRAAITRCRVGVERHRRRLTRLDAVLGDGDHGDNLVIGFRAAESHVAEAPPDAAPGELLRAAGHRLVAAVGGASGPLYGTAFIEAGFAAGNVARIDGPMAAAMLEAAAAGVARRGPVFGGRQDDPRYARCGEPCLLGKQTRRGATRRLRRTRCCAPL